MTFELAETVEDGEIFVAHIAKCGNDRKNRPEPSKTVVYAAVFDGSRYWLAGVPTVRTVATNMASALQTKGRNASVNERADLRSI